MTSVVPMIVIDVQSVVNLKTDEVLMTESDAQNVVNLKTDVVLMTTETDVQIVVSQMKNAVMRIAAGLDEVVIAPTSM